jgi:hypothetical protein
MADTLYADDTSEFFCSRADAVQGVPLLVEFLEKFGLFVARQASQPEEVQVGAALPRSAEGLLPRLRHPRRRGPFGHI